MSDPKLDPAAEATLKGGAHHCPSDADHDREVPEVDLLSPLTIRGVTLPQPDRDVADVPVLRRRGAGRATGTWSTSAAGRSAASALVIVEATAVTRDGRITPRRHGDLGRRARRAAGADRPVRRRRRGPSPGIQLAHAGRKASCDVPWKGGRRPEDARGRGLDRRRPQPDPVQRRRPRRPSPLDEAGIDARRRRLRGRRPRGPWPPGSGSSRSTRRTATCSTSSSRR